MPDPDEWAVLGSNDRWIALQIDGAKDLHDCQAVFSCFIDGLACTQGIAALAGVGAFIKDLERLHGSLEGSVRLEGFSSELILEVGPASPRGYLPVRVTLPEDSLKAWRLEFVMKIEQSYLVPFISGLKRQFFP
jgi:hypothetical protein